MVNPRLGWRFFLATVCLGFSIGAVLSVGGCHRSRGKAPLLAINEIMASPATRALSHPDGSLIQDREGAPSDWVEIHNPLPIAVNLASFTLSDEREKPRKFQFPPVVLDPGQFVIVILDGNEAAGPLHAGFKLSADGEDIFLFGNGGRVLVDRQTYRDLESDATAGRYPDGKEDYGVIYGPTPGKPNKRIGVRPPRFRAPPGVNPEAKPEDPSLVAVQVTVLEDAGIEILRSQAQRAKVQVCSGPFETDPERPDVTDAFETGRRVAPDEPRRDVYGRIKQVPQVEITYTTLIPLEPEGTILRLRALAENEIGVTEGFGCHRFGAQAPLLINEFQPRNKNTILFDRYSQAGELSNPGEAPDWIEILNTGSQPIDIAGYFLLSEADYDELVDPTPPNPPELFLWRFQDVGITTIAPGEYLLVIADDDFPYQRDEQGRIVQPPVAAYRTYARVGQTDPADRRYRSARFKLSGGDRNDPTQGDGFYLLDPSGVPVDSARFNFADQPDGQIVLDASFGRYPDANNAGSPLTHFDERDGGGRILVCPTPEAPNILECDLNPTFSRVVFTDPRCPGPGNVVVVTAFVSIDQDTVLRDTPESPTFAVEMQIDIGGRVETLRRGAGLEVRPPTADDLQIYSPDGVPGTQMFLVRAEIAGQAAGTLVTFSYRARDFVLSPSVPGEGPDEGWVSHSEVEAPEISFRFKSGYQRPRIVINEVFPNSDPDPLGAKLRYGGPAGIEIPQMDFVELFNPGDGDVDLSGMFLHDEGLPAGANPRGALREFKLPEGAHIPAKGFLCLFFPRTPEEEAKVPGTAIVVPSLGLDDCKEALFLLSSDLEGNCVVAEAQWDIEADPGVTPRCPFVAVGLRPDGESTAAQRNLDPLPSPTPCFSNCGQRKPQFSEEPLHFPLSSPATPSVCVEEDELVLIRAAVLIDSYAALVFPNPVQGSATGVKEATLLVRKNGVESQSKMDLSALPNPPPPDECWVQVRLNGQIRGPHPAVTFYRVRVTDGLGNVLESQELSFGTIGTKPEVAINEVMALNVITLADEKGKFPSWIELWNYGAQPVNLGGMFLTDSASLPRKWQIPEGAGVVLAPRGCLVIFADGDTASDVDLHASLAIKADGPGALFLLDSIANGHCIVNQFAYDFRGVPADISIGRRPDGTGAPIVLPKPTPCGANSGGLFLRGDVVESGHVNVTDMAWLYQILFYEREPEPACQKAMDANDDGKVDVQDGAFLGRYLFLGGPPIPPPYPEKGLDPTSDDLPCG